MESLMFDFQTLSLLSAVLQRQQQLRLAGLAAQHQAAHQANAKSRNVMPEMYGGFYPFNKSLNEEMGRLFDSTMKPTQPTTQGQSADDILKEFRRNGKDYEYCPELERGELPKDIPRRSKKTKKQPTECVFCKNNGEEESFYTEHILKDKDGKVQCPILRAYTCPICGVTGEDSHTLKYCPKNKNPEPVATANALKSMRNSAGKRKSK